MFLFCMQSAFIFQCSYMYVRINRYLKKTKLRIFFNQGDFQNHSIRELIILLWYDLIPIMKWPFLKVFVIFSFFKTFFYYQVLLQFQNSFCFAFTWISLYTFLMWFCWEKKRILIIITTLGSWIHNNFSSHIGSLYAKLHSNTSFSFLSFSHLSFLYNI